MVRFVLVALVIVAGCGGHSHVPAWPRSTPAETDGGESLAPRASVPSIEDGGSPDEVLAEEVFEPAPDAKAAEPAAPGDPASPATTPAGAEEPIMTEEMVIEVEE